MPSGSTTSGSKSNHSNPSTSISKSNKKRKTNQNQKTLGMAWGANSRSSSRPAFHNSPFPDFGSYMGLKNQKLHQQFDAEASSSSHSGSTLGKPIFQGVSIFVDGYTVPSNQELRGYMLKHGGRFENYFSRHRVTHIICSNLPDSKIKNLRSFSAGLPVVKPTWVLDSVTANKLLSWVPYQLDQLGSETDNQTKLSAFFSLKKSRALDHSADCMSAQATSECGNSSLISGLIVDANTVGQCESTEHEKECHLVPDDLVHVNISGSMDEKPTNSVGNEYQLESDGVADIEGDDSVFQPQTSVCQASLSVRDSCLDNHTTERSSSSKITKPASVGHLTLSDANFVENYFKYSRLHFIGTWRNRYRKRFPTLSHGFSYPSCSGDASATSHRTAIIHVDMDCFFVAVVIRSCPHLREKPVAVCHSDNPRGTAEISSANYPARGFGIKAGMFVRDAKALCPHLVIFPYDFKAYEEVADQFYDILHKHSNKVQAVSCDEAFIDVTYSGVEDIELLASNIRQEILDATRCTASAGISSNMLMARVATRMAKPNGQCYIPSDKVDDYLCDLPVKALPSVGHVLQEKLKRRQILTCGQLRLVSKASLQKDFGSKTGDMLWNFSRGIDNRVVGMIQESKSVGADINWGVRFNDLNDTKKFIVTLCKEVSLRLHGCGVLGRTFTLKIKKRRRDAGEPVKYMGCGDCENLSRSITLPMATDDVDVLQRITTQLFGYFHLDAKDVRGMGLQASKLESADYIRQGSKEKSIRSWLVSSSARTRHDDDDFSKHCVGGDEVQLYSDTGSLPQMDSTLSTGEARSNQNATLPALDDLDIGVIESLPPEVLLEINDLYAGKLMSFISKKKEKNIDTSEISIFPQNVEGVMNEEGSLFHDMAPGNKEEISSSNLKVDNLSKSSVEIGKEQGKPYVNEMTQLVPVSRRGTSNFVNSSLLPAVNNLMPVSLSQVDPSVLQQLPEDLKAGIIKSLPAHSSSDVVSSDVSLKCTINQPGSVESWSNDDMWVGNPPRWVEKFRLSSCQVLNMFTVLFDRSGSGSQLSSIFQRLMSEICLPDMGIDGLDNAVSCLCELIKQYVEIKVDKDIEEIYVCSCLLGRLASRSKFFLQVYSSILPHLQAAVSEHYGGNLNISFVE